MLNNYLEKARIYSKNKNYREKHKYEIAEKKKKYSLEHREEIKAYHKRWRDNHKEKIKEYRVKAKEYNLRWTREYQKTHQEVCQTRNQKSRVKLRNEVLIAYGSKCVCCGETELKFLAIDHINGNGNQHRKEVCPNGSLYAWIRKNNYPNDFQILCHNCNQSKGSYGECPHETARRNMDYAI